MPRKRTATRLPEPTSSGTRPGPDDGVRSFLLRCRDRELRLEAWRPRIMGILNLTPDSFSDGGRFPTNDLALAHALGMIEAGADIVDVGGESTRPGSAPVPVDVQIRRVVPVIEAIASRSDALVSIDTTQSAVAAAAIRAGASIVNDTSALADDEAMAEVVASSGSAVVLMHRRGLPATMQEAPHYDSFMSELVSELGERVDVALRRGIAPDRILVDPGVGFGKRLEDNLEIHRSFGALHALGMPILFASSRKSFLGALSGKPPSDRLPGTIASNVLAAWHGAHVLRVHDVAEVREAALLASAVRMGPAC